MLTDIVHHRLAFLSKMYKSSGSLNSTDTRTGRTLLSSSRVPNELGTSASSRPYTQQPSASP